jgi:hypothetical protein
MASCWRASAESAAIAPDITPRSGRVADPDHHDTDTDAIRTLNAKIRGDARVEAARRHHADPILPLNARSAAS